MSGLLGIKENGYMAGGGRRSHGEITLENLLSYINVVAVVAGDGIIEIGWSGQHPAVDLAWLTMRSDVQQ